jgi:cytochrome oxidase Cu insertion factor (SCO1/SenC/PrrC family)
MSTRSNGSWWVSPSTCPSLAEAAARLGRYTPAMLAEGIEAPDFTVPDQDGDPVTLSDYRGRWLALWWFPKAFTSG